MTIGFFYVRTRYEWGVKEYSDFVSVAQIMDIVGQTVFLPILGILQIRDSLLVPVLLCTVIAKDVIKGFANDPWMYYLGSAVNMMGLYTFSLIRSIMSRCVENHELGKVFALLAAAESLVPIGMSQVYASLWKATGELGIPWVGTVFFMSAFLTSIAWIMSVVSLLSLKGTSVGALEDQPAIIPSYRLSYKFF